MTNLGHPAQRVRKLMLYSHDTYGLGHLRRNLRIASHLLRAAAGLRIVLATGSPVARQLRRRLAARAGRSAFSLGPLLTGAAAGAYLNSRETRRLGQDVRRDLRRRTLPAGR